MTIIYTGLPFINYKQMNLRKSVNWLCDLKEKCFDLNKNKP